MSYMRENKREKNVTVVKSCCITMNNITPNY